MAAPHKEKEPIIKKILLVIIVIVSLGLGILLFIGFGGLEYIRKKDIAIQSSQYQKKELDRFRDKNWDKGIAYFEGQVKNNPRSSQAYSSLGAMYYGRKDLKKALECQEKALKLDPANAEAHAEIGKIYAKKGELREAGKCFTKALSINPKLFRVRARLADVQARRGYLKEAVLTYTVAKKRTPVHARSELPGLTTLHYLQGRYEAVRHKDYVKAVDLLQKAVADEPGNTAAYCYLAMTYTDMKKYEDSIKVYDPTLLGLKSTPDGSHQKFKALICLGMGTDYLEMKDYDKAIMYFKQALECSNLPAIHKKLGDAYMKKGMNEKALSEYELARQSEKERKMKRSDRRAKRNRS